MAKRKATSKGSVEVGPVLELIVAMTDQFCRESSTKSMPSSVAVWLKSWPANAPPH